MRDHSFPAIDDLIRQVEKAAAARPNQVRLISELIRLSGDQGADPTCSLVLWWRGAVDTLAKHIPPERRKETTEAMGRLLVERLRARGVI
jgi:hypothetical protein